MIWYEGCLKGCRLSIGHLELRQLRFPIRSSDPQTVSAPIAPQQPNEQSSSISRMADINVVSHYANPSFNAEKEALDYFSRETVDLYRGYSHQLEQLKV